MKDDVPEEELRRARRVTHMGRVSIFGERGFRAVAYLKDLSTTGCQVISETPLQIGMELRLSLSVATDECDIVIEQVKVRWANGDRFGLEVQAFDPQERERLRLFLKTAGKPPASDVAGK